MKTIDLAADAEEVPGMDKFDLMIVGQICQDVNTDYDGTVVRAFGGAVLYSGYAAAASGAKTALLVKGNRAEIDPVSAFQDVSGVTVFPVDSATCTGCANTYFTPDRERRLCTATSHIEPYTPADLPDVGANIYQLAGLMAGDIGEDMIEATAARGQCAVDVQGFLRRDTGAEMKSFDWEQKKEYLPLITYLKTDAAEAEIMTGRTDRYEAARMLQAWGAKEVMITHNTEVIVYDGRKMYACPLKPRNLSGRTGRGDTTFAGYLAKRPACGIEEALLYAAALVSLKMETPGPFKGTEDDVRAFMKAMY